MSEPPSYQLRWRGRTTGPHSLEEILHKLDEHEIGLWHEIGEADQWTPLGDFLAKRTRQQEVQREQSREPQRGFGCPRAPSSLPDTEPPSWHPSHAAAHDRPTSDQASATPPEPTAADTLPAAGELPRAYNRNRKLFIALGVLLGFTGAHNFYAGYWGTGLVQLLLTTATLLLGFGFIISWIWALVELLVVYTDARGRTMT